MNDEQKELIRRQEAKIQDYKKLFGSDRGKRVLHDMMLANYVLNPTWSASTTPHEMAMREGARSVIIKILTIMEVDPTKLRELARGTEHGNEN